MLYYSVRDIGIINEILSFLTCDSNHNITGLIKHFPELASDHDIRTTSSSAVLSFPHKLVAIVGHAGSGKTHILKHIANRKRTMFYAPSNAAGINLQATLWPSILHAAEKKKVYKTIHSFYKIQPAESTILGQCVQKARIGHESHDSYDDYLVTMFKACKPFCEKLFTKDMSESKLSPDQYNEYKTQCCGNTNCDDDHERVITYIHSLGLGSKIPDILLYDTCVLEEAGRTPDYMAFLFLFYYYYMHIKYKTFIWNHKTPSMIYVGSPTQSRVIDNYTSWSALTFAGQDCLKNHIMELNCIKIKSFKDNRRITMGNIDNNTTLAAVIGKLELGMPVVGSLRDKFNSVFVTDEANFFNPLFKPNYFRIAKKHEHLKSYKENVYRQNQHNAIDIPEFILSNQDIPAFTDLEGHINVKFKSEKYQSMWCNTKEKSKLFEEDFIVYKTSRTLLKGFRYLLTEYHKLYICNFSGTIQQFVETTDLLQSYMASDRSNCISFFVDCAKYIIEDVFSDIAEQVAKGMNDLVTQCSSDQPTIQHLLSLKTLLQHADSKSMSKVYSYASEKPGSCIVLPKDIFSFVLIDADVKKKLCELDRVCISLQVHECILFKLYHKVKAISTSEISSQRESKNQTYRPNKKRKLSVCDREDEDQMYEIEDDHCSNMSDLMNQLVHKSFFKIIPMVLHICATIDSTQGLTIHSPILALLKRDDRAEDMIVALSRTSNPDSLLVANKIFDQHYEHIAYETRSLIKMINQSQKKDGWL